MAQVNFKTFENKHLYDAAGYEKFISELKCGEALWTDFLPTPVANTTNSIILRMKMLGSSTYETIKIPNLRLYTLKNEIRYGLQYGFACTNFFQAMKTISHTKQWFSEENAFKAYRVNMENQDDHNVIDYVYKNESDRLNFLKVFLACATLFGNTNKLMHRWSASMVNKPSKTLIMNRFADYSRVFLILNGVNSQDYVEGEGKTEYHFFHNVIEQAQNIEDFKCRLSSYNLRFEQLLNGFELFFATFNQQDLKGDKKVLEGIARKVYLG